MWLTSKILFGFLAFFFMASGWMGLGEKWRGYEQISKEDLVFLENTMTLERKQGSLTWNGSEDLFFLENTMIYGQKYTECP